MTLILSRTACRDRGAPHTRRRAGRRQTARV